MAPATSDWRIWSVDARLVVLDGRQLPAAQELVDGYLTLVDDAANRFRHDSEIRRVSRGAGGSVTISATLADLLSQALRAAELTDGDVDPTVGTAMRRLGYDRDLRLVLEDGAPARAEVRPVPGYRTVRLDGRELELESGVELDLGATAKAVAADRCAALVHNALGTGVLVSLGGDIATAGPAPAGGWQIEVRDRPEDPADLISLPAGAAVATSSTVTRQWRRGGRTLHHVVDPRTGQPADPVWRSVTVAAGSCLLANTVTTAALVRGASAVGWVSELGLPARFVPRDGVPVLTDTWPQGEAA